MRVFKFTLLILLAGMVFGCQDKEMISENETLKSELENAKKDVLELERELISTQNELTSIESDLESKTSTLTKMNESFSESDLVGSYEIMMKCVSSDCSNTKIGDMRTERWRVSKEGNNIQIKVYENETTDSKYLGTVRNRVVSAVNPRSDDKCTMISLEIGINGDIMGERIVYNADCEIHYELTVKRT